MKYYTVWIGRKPGIYDSWKECKEQISGFRNSRYKSFPDRSLAEKALREDWEVLYAGKNKETASSSPLHRSFPEHAYACDASCPENPGKVEYRTMDLKTGKIIISNTINFGTNNLGEFLGIVHTLAYLEKRGITNATLYTDSATAIKWVTSKKTATRLPENDRSKEIHDLTQRATEWLKNHTIHTKLMKWNTDKWGEIPADFGRK